MIKPMLVRIFDKGECVYDCPKLSDIRDYAMRQIDTLWDEVKRLEYPHTYYVDLSERLWLEQRALLENNTK